jgi:hypothetical protein
MSDCNFNNEKDCLKNPICKWNININNVQDIDNKIQSCNISCSSANDNKELCEQNKNKCVWVDDKNLCKLKNYN